ncbi:MAG: PhoPQ-activated protein PqaA family protein [Hyphomonadaceae bacterium]
MKRILGAAALALAVATAGCQAGAGDEAEKTAAADHYFHQEIEAGERTSFDDYMDRPESVYGWTKVSSFTGEGYTADILELTSQTWRSEKDVDKPVWKHWLTVIRPDQIDTDTGFLYITGGSDGDPPPEKAPDELALIATKTHSIVTELRMVPNQPLHYTDTPDKARYEDDSIAYTWRKQIETGEDEWLIRMAMVKSGVQAMTAVQAFAQSEDGGGQPVNRFVVAGASKRGWTTWLVGAMDTRVVAIMPLVIDALNTDALAKHHYEVLGFFAPSLGDYVHHGIIPHMAGDPAYQKMLDIEDPYSYRHRKRMALPKYAINAAGDQYFHPDTSQFYWADIPEEKTLRYVPNTDHGLGGSDVIETMIAFYDMILTGTPRPTYAWSKAEDGTLSVTTNTAPKEVRLWQAYNPDARDFRVESLGKKYTSTVLEPREDGSYAAKVEQADTGFKAWFIELTWDTPSGFPFKATTGVTITPDIRPYKWEDAAKQYAHTLGGESNPLNTPENQP